jgi:L-ascorbate metabolism protein UlaG (beta-lactamase superfamily)
MKSRIWLFPLMLWLIVIIFNFSPSLNAQNQKVTIYYEGNAQVELLCCEDTRILIDVALPDRLIKPATKTDILLTTHMHSDHYNPMFSFPGRKIQWRTDEIQRPDMTIKSVVAAHSYDPPTNPRFGSNYIFIIEMAGFRVIHFGDTEQDGLTEYQVDKIGDVDVAIMEFWVDQSGRFFKIADQVKPRLIIPTHLGDGAAQYASEKWKGFWLSEKSLVLTHDNLPTETSIVFMGRNKAFGKYLNLPLWGME